LKIKLRYLLTVAFTIVAVVPLMFLGFWVERTALEKEVEAVHEKHLLLADHTAALLERYSHDLENAFNYFTSLTDDAAAEGSSLLVVKQLGIRHFCIVDNKARVIRDLRAEPSGPSVFNAAIMKALMPLVDNRIAYSPVMAGPSGQPTIYMVKRLRNNRVALAALQTD